MWHMQQKHKNQLMDTITNFLESAPQTYENGVKGLDRRESRMLKENLHAMYHPSPAISLLEKLSYSKPAIPATHHERPIMDMKKWDEFALREFEAARMTGELDAVAHQLPEPVAPPAPVDGMMLETAEGMDADKMPVDKMCGCAIEMSSVCASDGETYPSKCFAECAGLTISHAGPCLDKNEIDKDGAFKVLAKTQDASGTQTLMAVPSVSLSANDMFGDDALVGSAAPKQMPGVDFASLPRSDELAEARMAKDLAAGQTARDVVMPHRKVVTHRQFEDNLGELARVAQQFEPVLKSEKLAQCECHGSYSPVCGVDHQTYPSPCYASCVGQALKHAGPCRDDEVALSGATSSSLAKGDVPESVEEVRDPLCFCSLKEKSVCGVDGVTYTNRCFADCVHVRVRNDGPCYTVRA
jgi:hypothetical protein